MRQAISEECSDDINCASTSSPPNGFISPRSAPLKKRRVFNLDATDDVPSPKEDFKDLPPDEDLKPCVATIECKSETEESACEKVEPMDANTCKLEKEEPIELQSEEAAPIRDSDLQKLEPIESDEEDMDMFQDEPANRPKSTEYEMISPKSEPEKLNECTEETAKSDEFRGISNELTEIDEPIDIPVAEIEVIQQKLHSFHSENLMILQTRNRKRISRATTPTSLEDSSNASSSCNTPSYPTQKESTTSIEYGLNSQKSGSDSLDSTVNLDQSNAKLSTNAELANDHQSQNNAIEAPTPPNSHVFSNYGYNTTGRNDATQSYPILSTQYINHPDQRYYVHVNGNLPPLLPQPSQSMIYPHYSENAGANLRQNWVHTNIPPPSILNSSSYLKSYSTLSEPSPSTSSTPNTPTIPSPSSTPLQNPKVFTRTQSADPRLNPQKDVPSTTPKRKLSINEYRKRKQLNVGTGRIKRDESTKNIDISEQKTESIDPPAVDDVLPSTSSIDSTTKSTGIQIGAVLPFTLQMIFIACFN